MTNVEHVTTFGTQAIPAEPGWSVVIDGRTLPIANWIPVAFDPDSQEEIVADGTWTIHGPDGTIYVPDDTGDAS